LLVVPVVAKFLALLPSEVTVPLHDQPLRFHFALPFSWVLLFFCALFVSIGNAIYSICCPPIVKWFRDFKEFNESGRGRPFLAFQLEALAPKSRWRGKLSPREALKDLEARGFNLPRFFEDEYKDFERDLGEEIMGAPSSAEMQQREARGPTFHVIRDLATQSNPVARRLATICYLIGFVLLGIILAQNVIFVLRFLLKSFTT